MNRIYLPTVLIALATALIFAPNPATAQDPGVTTIVDVLEERGEFTILLEALEVAELEEWLRSDGPITLFAPKDEAFEALSEERLEEFFDSPEALAGLVGIHLSYGEVDAAWLARHDTIDTVFNQPLTVSIEGDLVRVDDAVLIETGIMADNGLIHVVDRVILLQ